MSENPVPEMQTSKVNKKDFAIVIDEELFTLNFTALIHKHKEGFSLVLIDADFSEKAHPVLRRMTRVEDFNTFIRPHLIRELNQSLYSLFYYGDLVET